MKFGKEAVNRGNSILLVSNRKMLMTGNTYFIWSMPYLAGTGAKTK